MNAIVFVGPTIDVDTARAELDVTYRPPAAHGDVYRAASERPVSIGIVDGLFERVPAVWHKEILWALKEGIHVFGSASMGALRAAELHVFGMVGVGQIFEAYRDGSIEADDEVAVAHAGSAEGFASLSEAMVNIRATLAAAERLGLLSPPTHARLISLAKSCFYPDRSWAALLDMASAQGGDITELDALAGWLPVGRVDQKRLDAVAMLRLMAEQLTVQPAPKRVRWFFEHTELWEKAKVQAMNANDDRVGVSNADDVLDEIRLDPEAYAAAAQAGMLRMVTLDEARRRGAPVSAADRAAMTDEFRRRHQLLDAIAVERWAGEHGLGPVAFARLMEDEVLRRRMEALAGPHMKAYLLDHLRVGGQYRTASRRAQEKNDFVQRAGFDQLSCADAGLTEEALLRWYFEERLGRASPQDPESYARSNGFDDAHALRQAVLREYFFSNGARHAPASQNPTDSRTTALFGPDVTDPFQLYRELRGGGAHWDTGLHAWLITDFDDVVSALRDRRLVLPVPAVDGSTPPVFDEVRRELATLVRFRCLVVNHLQGRRHMRIRRALLASVTGDALDRLGPRVLELAHEVFERRRHSRKLDVAVEFAHPLADAVMGAAIGIPGPDLAQFGRWCTDVFLSWPEAAGMQTPAEIVRQSFSSMCNLNTYLQGLVTERRSRPCEDLLSALTSAVVREELTSAELVANIAFVHESGRHTTGDLICNSVLSLLENADELARVRADPGLLESCADEFLRYDSPVGVVRVATEDLELGGAGIRAGETLIPVLNAANRDPERFADPDRLCLDAQRDTNVGFGAGLHLCIGAALARVEVVIALQTLVSHCPDLELGPEPPRVVYHQSTRRLDSLPVRW